MAGKIKKTNYVKINNKLDKEHEQIFSAIDKLYNTCSKHWKTEDDMYKKGKKLMPKGHPKVNPEWKKHVNQHKALLKKIRDMKAEITNHIEKYDAPHFHWNT